MRPSFPVLTFPNHYTIITGLRPDRHGIVGNTIEDENIPGVRFHASNVDAVQDGRWWEQATPLWVTARQRGLVASTMFWPGSEAPIHGIRPSDWVPYDKALQGNARVDRVLAWFDRPPATRPRLVVMYLDAIDIVGHHDGPHSAQIDAALVDVDATLDRLLRGLRRQGLLDRMNIVIVSDHGMAAVGPAHVIQLDDVVPPEWIEPPITGELAGIRPKPGRESDVEGRLLRQHPHMQCWRRQDMPRRLRYGGNPRVPPLLCQADEGWTIKPPEWRGAGKRLNRGSHGYDPDSPTMRAIFIAAGPAFPAGRVVAPFDNVDVYPMLARLIGVQPLPGDGATDLLEYLQGQVSTPTPR